MVSIDPTWGRERTPPVALVADDVRIVHADGVTQIDHPASSLVATIYERNDIHDGAFELYLQRDSTRVQVIEHPDMDMDTTLAEGVHWAVRQVVADAYLQVASPVDLVVAA